MEVLDWDSAISKRLCELMGGTMWVEQPEVGSTFTSLRSRAAPAATGQRLSLSTVVPELAGKKVLIVDDNERIA